MNPFLYTTSDSQPVLRLDLDPQTGSAAQQLFQNAAQKFRRGIEERVKFDAGYQVQEGECFQISDFALDANLMAACQNPLSIERLNANQIQQLNVKSIVGYYGEGVERELYFQSFDSRRVLAPGKKLAIFAIADSSTFKEIPSPVITLGADLVAIWKADVLTFKSYHLARRIFDLAPYFESASDTQVNQFSTNALFSCSDSNVFLQSCSEWHRRKIALILRSGGLANCTKDALQTAAAACEYDLVFKGEQIQLPTNKAELRSLLQFLDEDIYRGPFSQNQFVSSGKRVGKAQKA